MNLNVLNNVDHANVVGVDAESSSIIVSVETGMVVYCNDAAGKLYSLAKNKIIGREFSSLAQLHGKSESLFDYLTNHLNTQLTTRQVLLDGNIKHISLYATRAIFEQKEYLSVQLHEENSQDTPGIVGDMLSLQSIFKSFPNILLRVSERGEILNTNIPKNIDIKSMRNDFGIEYGKILGCIHSLRLEGGCGSGNVCRNCSLRSIVTKTFETKHAVSVSTIKLHIKKEDLPLQDKYYEVFTNYLHSEQQPSALISISDVTAEHTSKQQLSISQAQLWALIESNSDFMWTVEPETFSITMFNTAMKQFVEQTFLRVIGAGQLSAQLFPTDIAKMLELYYRKALDAGTITDELHFEQYDVYVQLSFNAVKMDNKLIGVSVFGRDITERKTVELELQQQYQLLDEHKQELDVKQSILEAQNEQLQLSIQQNALINEELQMALSVLKEAKHQAEESNRLKSSILANLNHEIRTPLNAMCGFADLLTKQSVEQERKEAYVTMIKQSGTQLLSIVNNLLEAARLESSDPDLHIETIAVETIAQELRLQYSPVALSRNISFEVTIEAADTKHLHIKTDVARLLQVLRLIVENALKFTPSGCVQVLFQCSANSFVAKISDTGIGIAPEMHNKIFDMFQQVDMGVTRQFGGNGLGLTIVKHVVQLLGGEIRVDSALKHGSCFTVSLPMNYDEVNATSSETDSRSKTILVAEDDDINFMYLEAVLSLDYSIIRANNGQEAIDLCRSNPEIEYVLMDVRMPVVTGIEAVETIKTFRPSLPVIATTAFGLAEDRAKLMKRGFDDYIAKPINADVLLAMLKK